MKIAVLMKRVPDTASTFKIGADAKSVDTSGLKYVMSPYDEHAMEEAIATREAGKAEEVIVFTMGPEGFTRMSLVPASVHSRIISSVDEEQITIVAVSFFLSSFNFVRISGALIEGRSYSKTLRLKNSS